MKYLLLVAVLLVIALIALPARAQTVRYYDDRGRATGSATTDSQGTTRFYDERGRSTGTATPDSQGTTRFYDERGRSIGSSTSPSLPHSGGKR
jgi:YD repeat-containing protein